MKIRLTNALHLPFAKGGLRAVASISPLVGFDGARMLRVASLLRRARSVLCVVARSLPLSITPPPPPPDICAPGIGCRVSGKSRPTMTSRRRQRLPGVLLAVALALPAGTAQAQVRNVVTALNILGSDSPYTQGEVMRVEILFARPVTVRGNPTLALFFDNRHHDMRHANFNPSATPSLIFHYTIQPDDDSSTSGITIFHTALQLNGGSITDEAGNPANLSLAEHVISQTTRYKVDGIPPRVTRLTFTTRPPGLFGDNFPSSYLADEEIKVRVDFAEPVTVTGSPRLRLDMGTRRVRARYDAAVHNTNNRSVGFTYRVQPGDLDPDGISIAADALASVGTDTITDAAGNPTGDSSLAEHAIGNDPAQTVDAVKPQVTEVSIISRPAAGDTYREGETIQLRVVFSEGMLIHPPNFQVAQPITLGLSRVMAEGMISPQSHTYHGDEYHTITEVVFHYTVQADDYDTDGISYLGTPRDGGNIYLGGRADVIFDVAGNSLLRDITDLIITNAGLHKVDGGVPRVTHLGIVSRPDQGDTYRQGEEISVTLTFNRSLVGDPGNLRLTLNLDSGAVVSQSTRPDVVNRNQHVGFTFIVQDGDLDEDGISIGADALSLTSGSVTNAGNDKIPLLLTMAEHTVTNHPAHKVDGVAPKVTHLRIVSTPAQGAVYRLDEMIRVRLTLDQPVMPGGSPILSMPLLIGAVPRTLTFDKFRFPALAIELAYQVQGGDLDEDGISIGAGGLKVTGGSLTDAVGNPLRLSLEGHTLTNAPAHQVGAVPRFMDVNTVPDQIYTVGQSVSLALPQAIGGVAPRRYGLTGSVPPGLVFDADTRTLSGTPSAPMAATELQWMVTDAVPSVASLRFQMTVVAAPSFGEAGIDDQIYTASAAIPDLTLPEATSALDLSYTLTPLPDGLAVDPTTRTLSGTPTTPAAATELEWSATDSNGASASLRFQVRVAKPPRFVAEVEDMLIRASRYTEPMILPLAEHGHGDLTYNLQEKRGEQIRDLPERVRYDPASRELSIYIRLGVYVLVYTATDANGAVASQEFTVEATKPQFPGSFSGHVFDRGVPITPVVLPAATGGIGEVTYTFQSASHGIKYNAATRSLYGTPTIATAADLRQARLSYVYVAEDELGGSDVLTVLVRVRENGDFPPYIPMYFDPPIADIQFITRGIAFERVLPQPQGGTGANPVFQNSTSYESLPPGIQFNRHTRRLHGTAEQVTTGQGYSFRYTVIDVGARETISERLRIRVVEPPSFAEPLRLTLRQNDLLPIVPIGPIKLPAARDGAPPIVYTLAGDLPPGLAFDPGSRALSGRPTEDGVSTLTYTATDANGASVSGDFVFTVVDTVSPVVTGVSIISTPNQGGIYLLGEQIRMRLDFSEPVFATVSPKPIPSLDLRIGTKTIFMRFPFPADSNEPVMSLEGSYPVQAGDLDEDGISSIRDLALAGMRADLTDAAGNPLLLSVAANPDDPQHKVDGVVPKVSFVLVTPQPANHNTYALGEEIEVVLAFDSHFPVLQGQLSMQLTLESGPVTARNSRKHGLTGHGLALDFSYVVQSGDLDKNGFSLGANALMLVPEENVTDESGNPVNLSLADFAFTDDPAYQVDGVGPQVTAVTITSEPRLFGYYRSGERITARVDFDEPLTLVDDAPVLWMSLGDDEPRRVAMEYAAVQPDDTSLLFGYTVQAGDEDDNGVGIGANALEVTSGMVTDIIGNPADLSLSAQAIINDPLHKVDGVGLRVTSVRILSPASDNPDPSTFKLGEYIRVLVSLDSDPHGDATALRLVLGMESGEVILPGRVSLNTPRQILFRHTVQLGDLDKNGVSIGADALSVADGGSVTDDLGNPVDLSLAHVAITDEPTRKVDGVPPDIVVPAAQTFEATATLTRLTADDHYGMATSSDGTAIIDSNAPETFPLGLTIITWTATDPAGNAVSATQVVTVVDTTAPVITLLNNTPADNTVELGTVYTEHGATATDAVDGDLTGSIDINTDNVDANAVGEYTVTYNVSDAQNNAAVQKTRTVRVTDTTAPSITAPDDETFEATATLTPLDRSDYGIARSSDGDITDDAPDTFPLGDTIITWTATDASSNEMTAKQTITVVDTTAPVITLPADVTKEATGPTTPVTVGQATATDLAADSVTITRNPTDNAFAVGVHKITWTATDSNGRSSTAEQTITITDETAPVITLPADVTKEATGPTTPVTVGQATAIDLAADSVTITRNPTDNAFVVGIHKITWTATDSNGRSSTAEQTITITDKTAPVITLPADVTKEATGPTTPVTVGQATATDLAADSVTITRNPTDNAFAVGIHKITWTATDSNGRSSTAEQTITITDTTKPVIALTGANPQTIEFGDEYIELKATATDLVDGDLTGSIVIDSSAVNTDRVGEYTVTYDVSDAAGNAADTVTRTVRVIDAGKPVITLTGDNPQTIHFGMAYTELNATATDLVDGDLTGSIVIDSTNVDTSAVGQYTVTYDVSDAQGNPAATVTRTVRVTDTTAPDITAPNDQTFEATATLTPLNRSDYGPATSPDGTAIITDNAPKTFPLGDTTITWTATDASDNKLTATQVITVEDTTAPVITLLKDTTADNTVELGGSYTDHGATATDLVDGDLTGSIVIDSTNVDTSAVGQYTVTYDVSDAQGNPAVQKTRTVRVTDTTAPAITAPNDQTFEATATLTPLNRSDYGPATSPDGTAIITDNAPKTFPLGDTTIIWTATDASDNKLTATQVITVEDTTAPVITLLKDTTADNTVELGGSYTDHGATATDLVDGDLTGSIVIDSTNVDTSAVGQYTVTYDVSDAQGNPAVQKTRTVRVTDTTAPAITAPNDQTFEATATLTPLNRSDYGPATSPDGTAIITDNAPKTFPLGDTTIIWTATDASDNKLTATQVITVEDTTAPVITLLKDTTADNTVELGGSYTDHGATATDLVDDDTELTGSIVIDSTNVDTSAVGQYTVTYDVSDAQGNPAVQKTRTVRVTDTTAPAITAPNDQTFEATATLTPLNRSDYGPATSPDGTAIITDNAPKTFPLGDTTIIWTATDASGNKETAEQTITITDTTAPVITLLKDTPADNTVELGGSYTEHRATATDLVDDDTELTDRINIAGTVDASAVGTYTVTYDVSDAQGNPAATVTRTVRVTDTTAPGITAPNDQTFEATATLTPLNRSDYGPATSPDGTAIITDNAPKTFPLGDTTITWTATDASDNKLTATQVITVEDTTAPVITLLKDTPADNTVELGGSYTDHGATATDLVDDDTELTDRIEIAGTVDTSAVGQYTVTYDVSDAQGNPAATVTRTVRVTDTTAPGITAPNDQTFEATATLTSLSRSEYSTATSTDGTAIITDNAPKTFPLGDTTITWTATDASDNKLTATQVITVEDTTAPVITLLKDTPADNTVELGGSYTDHGATATDLVDDDTELTDRIEIAGTVDTSAVGQYTVTYDVTDAQNNAAVQKTRTVRVIDTGKPIITLTGDNPQTIEFGEGYTELNATATDLVDDDIELTGNIVIDSSAVNTDRVGDYSVTYDVTDAAGNAAEQKTRTVRVIDTGKPIITLTGDNPQTIHFGMAYTELNATATDLVDGDLTGRIVIAGDEVITDRVGEYQVTYDVTDTAGNAAEQKTRTVRVIDTGKPIITLTGDNPQTIEFGEGYTELNATATDLVDDDIELTDNIVIDANNVDTSTVGTYTVTYDVTDTAGNAAEQKTRTVRVIDAGKPIITLTGDNPQTIEFGEGYTELNATATDLVDDDIELTGNIVIDSSAVNTNAVGQYTVTYNVTDTAGNAAEQKTRTVRVIDAGKPIITLTGDNPQTIHFGMAYTELNATATDLVDDDIELTRRIVIAGDEVITDRVGDYSVTYNVTDTAGNAAEQKTRTVRVIDTGKPIITLTGDNPQTIHFGMAYTELNATATDRVDGDLTGSIVIDSSAVNINRVGQYTVTYDVTDTAGNAAEQKTRTVRVIDTGKPIITLTGANPQTIEFGEGYAELNATATDRVDGDLTGSIVIDSSAVNTDRVGDYSVTYNVTDAAGNAAEQKTRAVRVIDTGKPIITLTGDNPQTIHFGMAYTELNATATDLVDGDLTGNIVIDANNVDTSTVGTYTVTYDVTDTAGNAAETMTRTVRVIDTGKPIITLTGDNPQTIHFGMAYTELNATATDLVDGELTGNIVIDSSAVNINRVGDYSVTYNVTDTAGNAAETMTRTVRVIDTGKPIITLTGDNPQTIHFGMAYTELNATATDLVDGDLTGSIVIDSSAVNINRVGDYSVAYDVTDTAGNAADTVTRTVRVIDAGKPIITLTGDNPQTIEFGEGYAELNATATDRVDGDLTGSIVIDSSAVNTDRVGDYSVTYDVSDAAGNAAEQKTRTVRVIDTGKPIITLTGDNPQIIEFGTAYTELEATATDLVDDDTELTSKIVIAGDEVIRRCNL